MNQDDADLPFRQVAQHLPIPCWISDESGTIVWVNDAWLAYTGKDVEALASEGLEPMHDPSVFPDVRRKWAETRAAGVPSEMTFPLKNRQGEYRQFHTRVVPLRDPAGAVVRWFGTNSDVTATLAAEARAAQTERTLEENEARLRLATEAAGVGVWEWRLDTNEMIYSARAREICGFPPGEPVDYDMVVAPTHPDDFPHTSAQAARALDPAVRDHAPYDYRIVRPSGEVRWVTAHGEAVFGKGADGEIVATRYVGTLIDVTERRMAEELVRESEQHLQMAMRAGRMAAWRVDAQGRLAFNAELNALIGLPADAHPSLAELEANYPDGELDRIRRAAENARARGDRHFEIEYRYRRADGAERWFYTRAEALLTDGGADGIIGVVMDITERKSDEERFRLLAREVDHRANNLLAVVQGIVNLSRGETADDLRAALRGRIQSLARAHQLLAQARWTGAELRDLVGEELSPYDDLERPIRVRVDGPFVSLPPATAQSLALVLHELATNAAKHGALSTPTGIVAVAWDVKPDRLLEFEWRELNGPKVAPPQSSGFGASVIARALHGIPRGEVQLDWPEDGLICRLRMELRHASAPAPDEG